MILYTPIPLEMIVEGIEDKVEAPEEIEVDGLRMQVIPVNKHEAKIVRLIQASPDDYLNPAYAPGQLIRYRPTVSD